MIFGAFLMLIAVSIAGVAAYFSVYGLAHIFAATFWSVVIMGGILEVGKLVATSFVYRYWEHLKWSMRLYLLSAIAGLMILTSAGIFGYLSNAYQQDMVGVKDVGARIELLDTELNSLSEREKQINSDIDRIGSNFVTARQNMIKQYGPEKDKLTKRIAEIRAERLELSTKQLEVEAHTGPIIYIAKAMNKGVDEAVMWMICLIIFVFDPLAVALTIGANIAMTSKRPDPEIAPVVDPEEYVDKTIHDSTVDELAVALRLAEQQEAELHRLNEELQIRPEPEIVIREVEVPVEVRVEVPVEVPVEVDRPLPEGYELIDSTQYADMKQAVAQAIDDLENLETELSQKEATVDQLTVDNQRLEDELFGLLALFEKKEAQIAQLKDAIRAQEQEQPMSIAERAELHARNQISAKSEQQ